MVDFSNIKEITIPEGNVKSISVNGTTLWEYDSGGLPKEYQQVEYIKGNGNQYINTNTRGNQNTEIRAKIATDYAPSSGYLRVYGMYDDNSSITLGFGSFNSKFDGVTTNANISYNAVHEIIQNKNGITVDGIFYSYSNVSNYSSTRNIYFFQINNDSNTKIGSIFYYFQIYDNGTLVRDFIPCYRKSDNVIGFYDLVSRTFFTNSGTGNFTKGGNV